MSKELPAMPQQSMSWSRRRRIILRGMMLALPVNLPLKGKSIPVLFRPVFLALTVLMLVLMSLLGFHPTLSSSLWLNDKVLHFICFTLVTGLSYMIWDVQDDARRIWVWRHFSSILTGFICFICYGVGSEFVQSLLPYKEFQWGDILANLCGASFGLWSASILLRRHRRNRELKQLYRPIHLGADESDSEDARGPTAGAGMYSAGGVWSDADSVWGDDDDDESGGRRSLSMRR